MGRASLVLLFWLAGLALGCCQTNIMQFVAYPPDTVSERLMGNHAWTIYAAGEIDADAGKRLAAIVAEKHVPLSSLLFLHSPGGNLLGGMELGRVIRKNGLNTYVGQFSSTSSFAGAEYCYSACALAFLGGEYRYLVAGSVYGVHRFFWEGHTNNDAAIAQIISAAVVEYISSMGVDTKLFGLASEAGSSQAITPTIDTLVALNVINKGRKPAKWTIESVTGAIY